MAYRGGYAQRRAILLGKLRAIGVDPGTNPRRAWERLDPEAQRTATNLYARQHPGYAGGGPAASRPTRRAAPRKPRRPRTQPAKNPKGRAIGSVHWSTDLGWLAQRIMEADPNAYMLVLAKLWGEQGKTKAHGWRSVWVGDKLAGDSLGWTALPEGPDGERNPTDPVQVSITSEPGRFDTSGRVSEGGYYRAHQYQDAIRAQRRGRRGGWGSASGADPAGIGGAFARAMRAITNAGGF